MQLWLPRMLGPSTDPTQSLRSARPQLRPSCRFLERSGFLPSRKVTAPKSSLSPAQRLTPLKAREDVRGCRARGASARSPRPTGCSARAAESAGLRVEVGVGVGALMAHRVRVPRVLQGGTVPGALLEQRGLWPLCARAADWVAPTRSTPGSGKTHFSGLLLSHP